MLIKCSILFYGCTLLYCNPYSFKLFIAAFLHFTATNQKDFMWNYWLLYASQPQITPNSMHLGAKANHKEPCTLLWWSISGMKSHMVSARLTGSLLELRGNKVIFKSLIISFKRGCNLKGEGGWGNKWKMFLMGMDPRGTCRNKRVFQERRLWFDRTLYMGLREEVKKSDQRRKSRRF